MKKNRNSERHKSSICYLTYSIFRQLTRPTPPQIHELKMVEDEGELNMEDGVKEEEVNMPSSSHAPDFEKKG